VLDISRYYLQAVEASEGVALFANWLPGLDADGLDREPVAQGEVGGRTCANDWPSDPCAHCANMPASTPRRGDALRREQRRALAEAVCGPNSRHRLARVHLRRSDLRRCSTLELHLDTMESRVCPGLYLCGEICDVDGRIGGFNFQWAWSSGFVAGTAAVSIEA
jgi:hypothetical protein